MTLDRKMITQVDQVLAIIDVYLIGGVNVSRGPLHNP